jgi:hypothetical protein
MIHWVVECVVSDVALPAQVPGVGKGIRLDRADCVNVTSA